MGSGRKNRNKNNTTETFIGNVITSFEVEGAPVIEIFGNIIPGGFTASTKVTHSKGNVNLEYFDSDLEGYAENVPITEIKAAVKLSKFKINPIIFRIQMRNPAKNRVYMGQSIKLDGKYVFECGTLMSHREMVKRRLKPEDPVNVFLEPEEVFNIEAWQTLRNEGRLFNFYPPSSGIITWDCGMHRKLVRRQEHPEFGLTKGIGAGADEGAVHEASELEEEQFRSQMSHCFKFQIHLV